MRRIGDAIGSVLGLVFFGYCIYAAFASGNKTAMIVVSVLVLIFIIAITLSEEKGNQVKKTVDVNEKTENKKSSYHEYGEYDYFTDRCNLCGGIGWVYYCKTCSSPAALEPSTEKYDSDMYCPECSKKGLDDKNIKEDLCFECDGTGKDPDWHKKLT